MSMSQGEEGEKGQNLFLRGNKEVAPSPAQQGASNETGECSNLLGSLVTTENLGVLLQAERKKSIPS